MSVTDYDIEITEIRPRPIVSLLNLREIVRFRDLAYFMILREVTVQYKQTILGFSWAVINPLVSMVVFSLIFGKLAAMPSDGVPYPIFSFAALVPWTYFANSVTAASGSLIAYAGVFTKVYFPRLFIPVVPVVAKLIDFSIAFVVLLGMMLWYGLPIGAGLLFLPVLVIVMVLTAIGLGSGLAALGIKYRDVRHATGFIIQSLMYATPVVWPLSLVPQKYHLILATYPMVGVVEGFRSILLHSRPIPWDLISVSGLSAVIIFLVGVGYFRRTERVFADVA